MKVLSLQIHHVDSTSATPVATASDLSSFSFYQRSTIQEFMNFYSRTVAQRTALSSRQSVVEQSYLVRSYRPLSPGSLTAVVITDEEYPNRVAFSLLAKVLDDFTAKVTEQEWEQKATESRVTGKTRLVAFSDLTEALAKYQDPKKSDAILKIQQELDETTAIAHKTIGALLDRGELLTDLSAKSDDLSKASKEWHRRTIEHNRKCCIVM